MKIKEQYQGMGITRGEVMLNTKTVKEENYEYYYNNGFADIFEIEASKEEKKQQKKTTRKPRKKTIKDDESITP